MSIQEKKLAKIALKIRDCHHHHSRFNNIKKRVLILYHEIVKDDVAIRAESLSYFTLFSIMPIIAGLFLLVSAFSQWAPIQNNFQELIEKILAPLPEEHRNNLIAFIFEFKDVYLQKISKEGSSLGFFAIIVLFVIMGKVFINIEDLMNRIWSTNENRSLSTRAKNLILTMVILPSSIFTALSLPGLVEKFGGINLGIFIEKGLPVLMLVTGLFSLYCYFPNVKVKPKNALMGALLSGVLFAFSNTFLTIYFRFGTQTAYGKAAVIPLVAFFIYVSWFIIMVGAEWSFVLQNENDFTYEILEQPSLQEASLLLQVIQILENRYHQAKSPVSEIELYEMLKVSQISLSKTLVFLTQEGIVLKAGEVFTFASAPDKIDLIKTVKEFLNLNSSHQRFDGFKVVELISKK